MKFRSSIRFRSIEALDTYLCMIQARPLINGDFHSDEWKCTYVIRSMRLNRDNDMTFIIDIYDCIRIVI